jgi:hypothetical protein
MKYKCLSVLLVSEKCIEISKHVVEENLNSIFHQLICDLFILDALKRSKICNILSWNKEKGQLESNAS